MRWEATPKVTLTASGRYESDRFEDDLNTRVLSSSVSLDARADWRLGDRTSLYLAVENLADTDVVVGQTGDGVNSFAAPRSFRLGITLK